MRFPRSSGVLLHPTSLPGPGGIGMLGDASDAFLETLAEAGQGLWQVLPLGPTGYGDSPYQSLSSFGGNPLLVAPGPLAEAGLLAAKDLPRSTRVSGGRVDFGKVISAQRVRLEKAADCFFREGAGGELGDRFREFREREASWVEDLALFGALKEREGGAAWTDWPAELARREPPALAAAREELAGAVDRIAFIQFLFFDQWRRVRDRAAALGIRILGDLPFFVALDSVDVWANRDLFDLEEDGRPRVIAGVPPDYFSKTGQRWGNPLYRWDVHRDRGWDWWIARVRRARELFDVVRIDHFRAFADYWEIPAAERTAVHGVWRDGPGADLFRAMESELGELPIIAEDLGDLSERAFGLRDELGFPGMRVLQFGFGPDPTFDGHSPHQHVPNCVVYTGTHDNDTTRGWFRKEASRTGQKARVLRYTGSKGREIHWDLIRLGQMSVADTAIVPLQDVLGLGSEARMNSPGKSRGNWTWRLREGEWTGKLVTRLRELSEAYGRTVPPSA